MNIILAIQGGLGKSICATAVCKAIKNNYPNSNLIVQTGYPEVFLNNKSVDMAVSFNQEPYFYTKYIDGKDVKIFANEPYLVTEHILGQEHLIETWCKMNGISYNEELPEISINEREFNFYANKYQYQKPIMVIQTNGGANTQENKYSWARDIPPSIVKAVIEEFSNQYQILHIRREDQPSYEKTIPIHENLKGIATLVARSQKRLFMDSFCQHLSASLKLKSTVLWIANKPNVFGYSIHDNLTANPENTKSDLRNAVYTKYNIAGSNFEFPYISERDIFNADQVISSIVNQ